MRVTAAGSRTVVAPTARKVEGCEGYFSVEISIMGLETKYHVLYAALASLTLRFCSPYWCISYLLFGIGHNNHMGYN